MYQLCRKKSCHLSEVTGNEKPLSISSAIALAQSFARCPKCCLGTKDAPSTSLPKSGALNCMQFLSARSKVRVKSHEAYIVDGAIFRRPLISPIVFNWLRSRAHVDPCRTFAPSRKAKDPFPRVFHLKTSFMLITRLRKFIDKSFWVSSYGWVQSG